MFILALRAVIICIKWQRQNKWSYLSNLRIKPIAYLIKSFVKNCTSHLCQVCLPNFWSNVEPLILGYQHIAFLLTMKNLHQNLHNFGIKVMLLII